MVGFEEVGENCGEAPALTVGVHFSLGMLPHYDFEDVL